MTRAATRGAAGILDAAGTAGPAPRASWGPCRRPDRPERQGSGAGAWGRLCLAGPLLSSLQVGQVPGVRECVRPAAPRGCHSGRAALSRQTVVGADVVVKRTRLCRNVLPSRTTGRLMRSMRKCRKSARAGSHATRYQSGGRISMACGSTSRCVWWPWRRGNRTAGKGVSGRRFRRWARVRVDGPHVRQV